jgi:flagellar biosynthesis repressor protein FlbT
MKSILISLNAGDKLYLNGAVIKTSRKVTLELLNEATFLLQQHVMQVSQATTPSRQMYFIMQTMLMDPKSAALTRPMLSKTISSLMDIIEDDEAVSLLRTVAELLARDKLFEAMKTTRTLFKIEDRITGFGATLQAAVPSTTRAALFVSDTGQTA